MIFWKRFNKVKPKNSGWYLCTVDIGSDRYVMDLWWDAAYERFRDNRRRNVFNLYEVYGYGTAENLDGSGMPYLERMYKDDLCDRTDEVVAWRKQPRAYMKGFKKMIDISEPIEEKEDDLGDYMGYANEPCPKCGRMRVEFWSSGKRICEKCRWCVEDESYYRMEE